METTLSQPEYVYLIASLTAGIWGAKGQSGSVEQANKESLKLSPSSANVKKVT